jgi:diguanylate cyclase (GGDEF)-like protein
VASVTGTSRRPAARRGPALLRAPAGWALWGLPVPLQVAILAVESTALLLVVSGAAVLPGGPDDLRNLLLLACAGMIHTEVVRSVERMRRRLVGPLHVSLASVWFLAGAVVLPPAWAGLCALLVQAHLWCRAEGPRALPHRAAFSAAVFVLAAVGAAATYTQLSGALPAPLPVLAAILVFFTVNTALVAGAIATSDTRAGLAAMAGDADENLLEIATLCLGGIVGAAVLVSPWLVVLALLPLLVLHRAVLVRHLERAASTDGKTGLLNAAAWHLRSERVLRSRRLRAAGLLVLDLDHFKDVNDSYGHLVGDDVLSAVADVLRAEAGDGDVVGRFGGEEFVVLVEGTGGPDAVLAVADRMRRQVAALTVSVHTPDGPLTIAGLSVSIGAVAHPDPARSCSGDAAGEVLQLLRAADTALYSAKRAGRNRVRIGRPPGTVAAAQATPEVLAERIAGH